MNEKVAQRVVMTLLVLGIVFAAVYAFTHPFVAYECEDRDGVRQAVQSRNGDIQQVVCNDGTIHPYLTRGTRS